MTFVLNNNGFYSIIMDDNLIKFEKKTFKKVDYNRV